MEPRSQVPGEVDWAQRFEEDLFNVHEFQRRSNQPLETSG